MNLGTVLLELNELPTFIFYFYRLKLHIESRGMRQNIIQWASIDQKKQSLKCQIFQSFIRCLVILNYAHIGQTYKIHVLNEKLK